MSNVTRETVIEVEHYTDSLFRIRTTRDPSFRFQSGEFTMIGLEADGRPLLRAYSLASAIYDEFIELYSIKVPNGPLTSRLQHIKVGDQMLIGRKAVGTLVTGNLLPGKRLYLLATGTGFAPFASLLQDPAIYELYDQIILAHSTRTVDELQYNYSVQRHLLANEFLGDMVRAKFTPFTSTTRDHEAPNHGRITDRIYDGELFDTVGTPPFNPVEDRVMICGNPEMMNELSDYLKGIGFQMGSASEPGHYVIEKAFAQK